MWDLVKLSIGRNVKDLIFQNLEILFPPYIPKSTLFLLLQYGPF